MTDANKTRLTIIAVFGLALLAFLFLKRASPTTANAISQVAEPFAMPFLGGVAMPETGDVNISFGSVDPYSSTPFRWPASWYQPLKVPSDLYQEPPKNNPSSASLNSNRNSGTCGGCGCTPEVKKEIAPTWWNNAIVGW